MITSTDPKHLWISRFFLILSISAGIYAFYDLFQSPSNESARLIFGFSPARLSLLSVVALGLAGLTALLSSTFIRKMDFWKRELSQRLVQRNKLLLWLCAFFILLVGISIAGYLYTYLFIPPYFRGMLLWIGLNSVLGMIFLSLSDQNSHLQKELTGVVTRLPSFNNLADGQRKVFRILVVIGLLYFLAFIIPNLLNAKTPHDLFLDGGDENITYQPLTLMLTPGETLNVTLYRFFIHEDYHYGYPFYFLSMLVILPVRLIVGPDFANYTQINLLLLRQFINIIPMIVSCLLLVYLQTRFRRLISAVVLFLFLLFVPAVISYNIRFWHPDGLVVLCVVLTLFFLDKDHFQFGVNFYLAAIFCGLTSAIKLYGFFFFLAIAGYMLAGLLSRQQNPIHLLKKGLIFITLMIMVILLSNPFIGLSSARDRFMQIMQEKSVDMAQGYGDPDPENIYRPGIPASLPFLERFYAPAPYLLLSIVMLITACLYRNNLLINRLILGWVLVTGIYLLYFVVVKSNHYWLPVLLPLFSSMGSLLPIADRKNQNKVSHWLSWAILGIVLLQILLFLINNQVYWVEWLRLKEI